MAETSEGLVVIDEGSNPETGDSARCCYVAIMYFFG